MQVLPKMGIPAAEVRPIPQVLDDPQLLVRQVIEQVPSADPNARPIQVIKAGYIADKDGPFITRPAPLLGQHTEEILHALDLEDHTIETLRSLGII